MIWEKIGRVFNPDNASFSYATLPKVRTIIGNEVEVYFSSRDANNASSVYLLKFDIRTRCVTDISEPMLSPGQLGCFDDSGVMATSVLHGEGKEYLFFIGWNLGVTVPFRNSIGLASRQGGEFAFKRLFDGPIVDRTRDEPHFCASCDVIFDQGMYKMWYVSCVGWDTLRNGKIRHNYHIKYAVSNDLINWSRNGDVAIDFKDKNEYAISAPCVKKTTDGMYHMWFSARGSSQSGVYQVYYANSLDGITWQRYDDLLSLSCSDQGWDSGMVEYPEIFAVNGSVYMLFNGNDYGKTGFGLARLKSEAKWHFQ